MGSQPALDGHNKFEADTSPTRNDYFLGKSDNFNFSSTLFWMVTETTDGTFDLDGLAKFGYERYTQIRKDKPYI